MTSFILRIFSGVFLAGALMIFWLSSSKINDAIDAVWKDDRVFWMLREITWWLKYNIATGVSLIIAWLLNTLSLIFEQIENEEIEED